MSMIWMKLVGMVWYGAPPTPCVAIVVTRWWLSDRTPAECCAPPGRLAESSAQTESESVPSALASEMGFVSTGVTSLRQVSLSWAAAPQLCETPSCSE
jgi:hypothetical protein